MFRNLRDWIDKLRKESRKSTVIVEGKRDREVLKKRGVKNILDISGKRFADILDLLEGKTGEVILLTDLDPQGEKIYRKIKELLVSQGFRVREDFREFLRKEDIIHIEDLDEGFKDPDS